MNARVLVVDDDTPFAERLGRSFSERSYEVRVAGSIAEAKQIIPAFAPTHAVLDLKLAEESGLNLISDLRELGTCVVMLTGYGSVATALEAVRLGAKNYLAKPASFAEIEHALFAPPLSPVGSSLNLKEDVPSLDSVEWEHIQRVLRDCSGNITHAAKRLGLHRQALQRKLKSRPLI